MEMGIDMKKIMGVLVLFIACLFVMCACGKSRETLELSDNIEAYETIAETALRDFQDEEHFHNTDSERYIVHLSEFTVYTELSSSVDIVKGKFSYLWIENGNVVFWNDETKVLGLVYSSNPKEYIKELMEWYKDMDSEKINEKCYTVGQWMHL